MKVGEAVGTGLLDLQSEVIFSTALGAWLGLVLVYRYSIRHGVAAVFLVKGQYFLSNKAFSI